MKRNLIHAALVVLSCATLASAQIVDWKKAIAFTSEAKGQNVFLETDKAILEPGETTRILVHLMFDRTDVESNAPAQEDVVRLDEDNPVYAIDNWKVASGGGSVITLDAFSAMYAAPKTRSTSKFAEISVELTPKAASLPRLMLKVKIYLDEKDTAFVLSIPDYGWINLKFDHALDNGVALPDVTKLGNAKLPPAARKQMDEAKKKIDEQNASGRQKLTTNGFAVHLDDDGYSAIKLRGLKLVANGNEKVVMINGDIYAEIKFFGAVMKGAFELGDADMDTGVGMYLGGTGVGCGDFGPEDARYRCDGKIVVTKTDDKYVYGTIRVTVWSSKPGDKFMHRGLLYGKFKVWIVK